MSKYKININKPLPSDQGIDGYKDFNTLYQQYQVMTRFQFWRELYRNPRYFASLVAMVAIGFLVHQTVVEESPSEMEAYTWQQPFEDTNVVQHISTFKASEGSMLTLSKQMEVSIPADAFVDEDKQAINGNIELRYRAFQDPVDMLLAGIPTRYDSKQVLESLAMLEIEAYQNGKQVFLAESKQIEISYLTTENSEEYKVYALNKKDGHWTYSGKDEIAAFDQLNHIPEKPTPPQLERLKDLDADTLIRKATPAASQKPPKPFRIKVDLSDFPELSPYNGINWGHAGNSSDTDPWINEIIGQEWDDVKLRGMDNGRYEIIFTRIDANHKITNFRTIARPYYKNMSYEEAMKAYTFYLDKYEQSKQIKAEANQKDQVRNVAQQEAWAQYQEKLKQWEENYGNMESTNPKVQRYRRTFTVNHLGIHCLGKPIAIPISDTNVSIKKNKLINDAEQQAFLVDAQ